MVKRGKHRNFNWEDRGNFEQLGGEDKASGRSDLVETESGVFWAEERRRSSGGIPSD